MSRTMEQAEIGQAIERAAARLPEGYDLHIEIERGAGTVRLYLADDDASIDDFLGDTLAEKINRAIDKAIDHNDERE